MEPKRENTIKLRFGSHTRNPTNDEVFTFFREQGWTYEDLSAMYREDYSLFVRFQSEGLVKKALGKLGTSVEFQYANGDRVPVTVTTANGTFRYVRIFGLHPEVKDEQIATVLGKYGTIHQLVRERYPAESGFPILNGIRGAHMEIVSEIPAQLHIQHVRARVFYEGMQSKCFACGALDHLKANCPKRQTVNSRLQAAAGSKQGPVVKSVNENGEHSGLFAHVVVNGKMAQSPPVSGMVVLEQGKGKPSGATSVVAEESGNKPEGQEPEGQELEGQELEGQEDVDMTVVSSKKRERQHKRKDSGSSESDAVSRKQIIIPSAEHSLLLAQARRSRSLNTKNKAGEKSK